MSESWMTWKRIKFDWEELGGIIIDDVCLALNLQSVF